MDGKDGTKQQTIEQHTPGPWKLGHAHGKRDRAYWIRGKGNSVPAPPTAAVPKLADARLIAAAPDLLEAAQFALRSLEQDGKYVLGTEGMLRNAIQKATGVTA